MVDWALYGLVAALAASLFAYWRARRRVRMFEQALTVKPTPRQILSADGEVLYANPACREFLDDGSTPLPEALRRRTADQDEAEVLDRLGTQAAGGSSATAELRLGVGGCESSWWRVTAAPLGGRRSPVSWAAEDITSRRQMEMIMHDEQRRFIDLLENAPVGFYSVDQDGHFLFVNQVLIDWLGWSRQEFVDGSIKLHDLLAAPPADGCPAYSPLPKEDRQGEVELRDSAGHSFRVHITQEVVRDLPEGRLRTRSVVRHLSREQATAHALHRSELRFRRFFDEAPVGIAQLDLQGRVGVCNRAFARMVGDTVEGACGRALVDLVDARDRGQVEGILEAVRRAEADAPAPPAIEVTLGGGEQELICSMTLRRFESEDGGDGETIVHLLDATEQKALEAQFAQSQKMQAVGQLAGGIAHDFNNLLTAMIGFSDLLLLRHRPGDQSFADVMQIKQNANRAANLVRQLLAFSRQQTLQSRVLNITDILAELSHLLRRLIGETIELRVVHGRNLAPVKADQGQLEQVIINLAVNARDAMSDGGVLSIRTSNVVFETSNRLHGEVVPAGAYVRIEVEDTGHGIKREHLDRVFDPFFTTKGVGEGTGLGLSTVYGIVKQTGGFVFVDSHVGRGTTFSIYLPQYQGDERAEADGDLSTSRDLTGIGRILLVEDEDAVRAFSARALRNKGYEVVEARSGEAALELLYGANGESEQLEVDLLITDVVMPRVDGTALVREARDRNPALRVIFISGYAEDSFRERMGNEAGIHFLAKPFSLKQLAAKVKEVMSEVPVN